VGDDGTKLGTVDGIYYDNHTDLPAWAAVRSGLFGLNVSLVPLAAAHLRGQELHVPFDKEQLKRAPHHDPGRELSPQDEVDLFGHYGMPYEEWTDPVPSTDTGLDQATATSTALDGEFGTSGHVTGIGTGRDTSGPTTGDAMTRSEEQLRVRTESQAVGRVRLRKHIITEYKQMTVPVRREEIRIEREPIGESDPNADAAGSVSAGAAGEVAAGHVDADLSNRVGADDEQEMVLYAERPVVQTETVAVERIRLGKRIVTEQETVEGEIRREQIDVNTDPEVHNPH
jgi:stress response protein YsnF